MPDLFIPKNYEDDAPLFESAIDDIRTTLLDFFNTTRLSNTNFKNLGIVNANIEDATITGNLLATSAVDDSTVEISSNSLSLKDGGIFTTKFNDGAVTRAKKTYNIVKSSSSSGSYSQTSGSWTNVTNMSISFTATGRPIFIGLIPADSSAASWIGSNTGVSGVDEISYKYRLTRDGTQVGGYVEIASTEYIGDGDFINDWAVSIPSVAIGPRFAVGCVNYIDQPSAGTYTYRIQAKNDSTAFSGTPSLGVQEAVLIAVEL